MHDIILDSDSKFIKCATYIAKDLKFKTRFLEIGYKPILNRFYIKLLYSK